MKVRFAKMVSILMGVYYQRNSIAMLQRSVESILQQSMTDFELIICDDGSRYEACEYLSRQADHDGRIVLVRPGECYSLPEKLNTCLEVARGEWIGRMDDDDYSHPDRLNKQVSYLYNHSEIAFVGCSAYLYRNGMQIGERIFPEFPQVRDFYFTQPFLHPALLFQREALEAVNGYSESKSCRLCEDYDLLLRLYHKGYRGANLPEFLFDYTLPVTAKGNRKMVHRWNETVTRYKRFRELGQLPKALPWVVKPVLVGLIPERILGWMKEQEERRRYV